MEITCGLETLFERHGLGRRMALQSVASLSLGIGLGACSVTLSYSLPAEGESRHSNSDAFNSTPLAFQPNRGQAVTGVRFLARGPRYSMLFGKDEATLFLSQRMPAREPHRGRETEEPLLESDLVHMKVPPQQKLWADSGSGSRPSV